MNLIVTINYLDILNAILCAGMVIHGVCLAYHFSKKTSCIERLSVALYTAGFGAVAIGPWFGYTTTDPAELAAVAGILIYTLCKEFTIYKTRGNGHANSH